jgi:hypothetical protein
LTAPNIRAILGQHAWVLLNFMPFPHELVLVCHYPCRICSLLTIRQHRPPQGSDGVFDINRKDCASGTLEVIEELFTYVGQWRDFVGDA